MSVESATPRAGAILTGGPTQGGSRPPTARNGTASSWCRDGRAVHTALLYRYRRVCFSPPSGQRWGTDPQLSQKRRDAALGMQSVGTGAGRASQRAFPAPLTPRSSHGRVPALRTSPCDWAQNRTLYGRAQNRTAPQSARTAPSHRTAPFRGGPGAGRGRPAPPPDLIDSAAVHWERRGRGLRTAGGSRRGRGGPTAAARSGAAVRRFGPIRPANVRL